MDSEEFAASLNTLPQAKLHNFLSVPTESLKAPALFMADSNSPRSPLRRECLSEDPQVRTPPQSEGLKAGGEDLDVVGPFPLFGQPEAPSVETVDTHSLSLSWVPIQLQGQGGNRLDESDLPTCVVGYSLEMQLVGTVSLELGGGAVGKCSEKSEPVGSRTG